MNKSISVFAICLAIFFALALFSSYTKDDQNSSNTTTTTINNSSGENLPQIVKSIDLNKAFDFAGEALPMDNADVLERLDRELLRNAYWHSSTVLAIKRANRYFPLIEKILAENGVPDDLKYIAVAESNLMNAVSPAGAKGIWQFMKGTGTDHGLEINSQVDERYLLEKSTKAACKFLTRYKEKFGSWTLAAAAYNMGGSKLSKEINIQRASTYYDLNLNQETARYVFRIVALKEILSRPRDFGFYIEADQKYEPMDDFDQVEVSTAIENLGDFAKKNGISYRTLKRYNPWLISSTLTNKNRKTYTFKIPRNKF